MKTVLASGVFDLLHYGHIRYLEEAKLSGGPEAKLIVIVATDDTVVKLKGHHPVMHENQRRALVEALRVVDEALLGYVDMDMLAVLEEIKPDIVAVGYDQNEIVERLRRRIRDKGLETEVVQVGRFGEEELDSSSKIKRRIVEDWRTQR